MELSELTGNYGNKSNDQAQENKGCQEKRASSAVYYLNQL